MVIEFCSPKEVRMFSHFRRSLGLALLLSLMASITVLAKGGFSFIVVTGADLKEPARITDPALTESFFAFANFFEDGTEAPDNPGEGYEITRFYLDGKREIAFDQLHYYPDAGLVFYDGIVNGESEYDGEWYTANPQIASVFNGALLAQAEPAPNTLSSKKFNANNQVGEFAEKGRIVTGLVVLSSLAIGFVLVYRFRRQVAR
jgi:hypothetical protein